MPRNPRRLGLLDAMILVAAVAVGLGWARYQATRSVYLINYFGWMSAAGAPLFLAGHPVSATLARIWRWLALSVPCVTTLALGLLIVRLREPRPRGGRVFVQPGAAACGAVAVAATLETVRLSISLLYQNGIAGVIANRDWRANLTAFFRPEDHGIAVVAAWSALLLARRMRCERSAIDRLGRAVGVFWIVALVLYWVAGGY